VDAALRADVEDYLPGDILVKIDRASMANGLELRAPFLDVDFAEFMLALPSSLKVSPQADKILLRKAFERDWPASVRGRSKQGFGAPVGQWLAMPRVKELDHALLRTRSSPLFDFLEFDGAQAVLNGVPVYLHWSMLALAVWARESRQLWSSAGAKIPETQRALATPEKIE
jgi:asparagine synthase (glutamine-hydrolysing)